MEKKVFNRRIKRIYGSKGAFCLEEGYSYTNFGSKLHTMWGKINWLNEFLRPLDLKVRIVRKKA